MSDTQPTDRQLAEEIWSTVVVQHVYRDREVNRLSSLIARHRADNEAALRAKIERLQFRLSQIAAALETAVCTEGIDKGIILLSDDGPTHPESVDGRTIQVYDHEYFSPLGDALIETWHLATSTDTENQP